MEDRFIPKRLTTIDNPWDPFNNFDEWFEFDIEKGYNSCGIVDRIAKTNDSMSEAEVKATIDAAIDRFVADDPLNLYISVEYSGS